MMEKLRKFVLLLCCFTFHCSYKIYKLNSSHSTTIKIAVVVVVVEDADDNDDVRQSKYTFIFI